MGGGDVRGGRGPGPASSAPQGLGGAPFPPDVAHHATAAAPIATATGGVHPSTTGTAALVGGARKREAETFAVPALPGVTEKSQWCREVRSKVIAASANPDVASVLQWLRVAESTVERPDCVFHLENTPVEFRTLDMKFADALSERINNGRYSELKHMIHRISDRAAEEGTVPTGRRWYYEVLQHLQITSGLGLRNSLKDLSDIAWLGDDKMEIFAHYMETYAREAIREGTPETTVQAIIYEKIKAGSDTLRIKLELYEIRPKDDPERTWEGLLRLVHKHVDEERNKKMREQQQKGLMRLSGNGKNSTSKPGTQEPNAKQTAAPAPTRQDGGGDGGAPKQEAGPPDPKKVCWWHNHGGCSRSAVDCNYERRLVKNADKEKIPVPRGAGEKGGGKATAKSGEPPQRKGDQTGAGKGADDSGPKGKGGGKSKALGDGPLVVCRHLQAGAECRFGDRCFNLHACTPADKDRALAARRAQAEQRQEKVRAPGLPAAVAVGGSGVL